MGKFKEFLSKAMRGETQALGVSGISIETAEFESLGYQEATLFLMKAFDYSFWHNVEIDEEDIPETTDEVLMAYRDASKKKGYAYKVGPFDTGASGWKEICFTEVKPKEIEFDDGFFDRRLESIRKELPNVLDFLPVRAAYINGFFGASQKMKDKIKKYKWHDAAKLDREMHLLSEEVLAVISEAGSNRYAVLKEDEILTLFEKDACIAWVNIEPFENILDQV